MSFTKRQGGPSSSRARMERLCFKRARLPCSQMGLRSRAHSCNSCAVESFRKAEANRQHLNPCGPTGCLSITWNVFLSLADVTLLQEIHVAFENPFLCHLGRPWGTGLQTWSQMKEFFSGFDYPSPLFAQIIQPCHWDVVTSDSSQRRVT